MPPKIVEKMLSFWSSKCYLWIFSGFTNLEDTQDDEGWCDGGSLLGRESLESFLIPPLFNRHNIGKHLIPPKSDVFQITCTRFFRQFGPLWHQEENLVSNLRGFQDRK